MKDDYRKKVEYIVSVLRDAGYSPYDQLYAYAITGNENYITRQGDARKIVLTIDRKWLMDYVMSLLPIQGKADAKI